jgi:hypothetical protein
MCRRAGQNEQVRIAMGVPPLRGRGLRLLALDGGGMKGLTLVELMKQVGRGGLLGGTTPD